MTDTALLPFENVVMQCTSLVDINLSDCSLTASTLVAISEVLKTNKKLVAINFSLNSIGCTSKDNQAYVAQFVENMETLIRANDKLFHLNLEGMQLKNHILKLGEAIRDSKSLHAVHLGSNQSSFHA